MRFELVAAAWKFVCQMLNQPHTHLRLHSHNHTHLSLSLSDTHIHIGTDRKQTKKTSKASMHKYFNSILFGYVLQVQLQMQMPV